MQTISVVMATYNGAAFIREQLESLAKQTLRPMELVVSDDGSTDQTVDLVREFADTSPFDVVVRQNESRLGYGANFLKAAEAARGDYIAFCDQDDVWQPGKLEVAVEVLSRTGASLFVHAADVIDQAGARTGIFTQGILENEIRPPLRSAPWGVFYGFSMVFPRTLLGLIDSSERGKHTFEHQGMLSHDLWVYFLATGLGEIAVDARSLVSYRQHQNNATPRILRGGFQAWTSGLGVAVHPDLPRAEIAAHRSKLTAALGGSTRDAELAGSAMKASDYWLQISRYEFSRTRVYGARGTLRRFSRLLGLVRSGGYRSYVCGGLGKKILVKDLIVGVMRVSRVPR